MDYIYLTCAGIQNFLIVHRLQSLLQHFLKRDILFAEDGAPGQAKVVEEVVKQKKNSLKVISSGSGITLTCIH